MDEKQLVKLAVKGDRDAFALLYSQYKDRLYRYAFYKLQNSDDAQDAVMDCVVAAYEQIAQLKKAEAFSAWIFRILYCSCNDIIKLQMHRRNCSDIDECELSCDMQGCTLKTELSQALDVLNNDEREIVLLSVVSGLSSKEISKICGLTSGSVRSKLSRSLSKMREFLE